MMDPGDSFDARSRDKLVMFTIYEKPADYPEHFVVRRSEVPGGVTRHLRLARTLSEARGHVPEGLVCMTRSPEDALSVVEVWF